MERAAMERELERLHADSWGWALACCSWDRETAEEVLQTAYLRVLSGRAKFGGGSSLKTWVFGVIRLTASEETRRHARWGARRADASSAVDVRDPGALADETVEGAERREALIKALTDLSPRQREVLTLVFYHALTIEQAADAMGVSLGSARTHYERGKKALARMLAHTLAEDVRL